jgi:GTPase SAR1 family protein
MGKSGVGKTLLIRRYVEDTFSHEYACTIGVDFKIKMVAHKNSIYKLQIWDTAG